MSTKPTKRYNRLTNDLRARLAAWLRANPALPATRTQPEIATAATAELGFRVTAENVKTALPLSGTQVLAADHRLIDIAIRTPDDDTDFFLPCPVCGCAGDDIVAADEEHGFPMAYECPDCGAKSLPIDCQIMDLARRAWNRLARAESAIARNGSNGNKPSGARITDKS